MRQQQKEQKEEGEEEEEEETQQRKTRRHPMQQVQCVAVCCGPPHIPRACTDMQPPTQSAFLEGGRSAQLIASVCNKEQPTNDE